MSGRGGIPFAKGQALGNDYAVIDAAALPGALGAPVVRAFCDRHRGIGSDGILIGGVAQRPFRLGIYNPDGSEAEKSGNGLRIFGAWLHRRGLVADEPFEVQLSTDTVVMRVEGEEPGGALMLTVAMGKADLSAGWVDAAAALEPLPERGGAALYRLDLGDDGEADVHPVSLGNPHCVVVVEALDREDFLRRAPRLCTHPFFPAGTNVQFARLGKGGADVWIWERGVGETTASGSSACAVTAVALAHGESAEAPLSVRMPGGVVHVDRDAAQVLHLRGPAQIVFEGSIPAAVWASWSASADDQGSAD